MRINLSVVCVLGLTFIPVQSFAEDPKIYSQKEMDQALETQKLVYREKMKSAYKAGRDRGRSERLICPVCPPVTSLEGFNRRDANNTEGMEAPPFSREGSNTIGSFPTPRVGLITPLEQFILRNPQVLQMQGLGALGSSNPPQ